MMNLGAIDDVIRTGVHAAPTWTSRAHVVQAQHATFLDDVARQANATGLDTTDVLGAHAMLGVRELDGIDAGVVQEAAKAAREIRRVDVAIISNGEPPAMGSVVNLAAELRARGAQPRILDAARLEHRGSELWYRGLDGAADVRLEMPEAVISRGVATRIIRPFEEAGVHMANRASTRPITLSKNLQAELFHANGVAHPVTLPGLSSMDEVRAAADQLGSFPVVVKESNGRGGMGVWIPKDAAALDDLGRTKLADPKPKSLLVQEYLDVGAADDRVTVARNVRGELDVVSVHHRVGQGTDGLANGPEGSRYSRVALDQVDDETRRAAIGAADAVGLDYAGVDVVTTSGGRKVVLEANGTPGIPEHDVPLPRGEHSLPAIADWLVYGTTRA